jgi:hypothetical protein
MDINIPLNESEKKINLGGFPPIFYISNETKKKREFNKNIETINPTVFDNLNILNIKNILSTKK